MSSTASSETVTLARTLRRRFVLDGPLPADQVRFLRALPEIEGDEPSVETISVHPRSDGAFAAECSWGRRFVGSARTLARLLEEDFLALGAKDEGAVLALRSTIVSIGDRRILVLGEDTIARAGLTIALLAKGFSFEGGWVSYLRATGVSPHPLAPRLLREHFRCLAIDIPADRIVEVDYSQEHVYCVIDPASDAAPWRIRRGLVDVCVFLDVNSGGWTRLKPLAADAALRAAMPCVQFTRRIDIAGLVALRSMISSARCFRLVMGEVGEAVDLLASTFAA